MYNYSKNSGSSAKNFLKIALIILIFSSLLISLTSCSGLDFGSLSDGHQNNDHFSGDNYTGERGDYIEGELIISLSGNELSGAMTDTKAAEVIRSSAAEQRAVLADTDFVLHNLFRDKLRDKTQDLETTGQEKMEFAVSMELMREIIFQLGYLNLVTFPRDKYDNIFQAAEKLETKFADAGIEVNYIEPNYIVQTASGQQMHKEQEWNYNMIKAPRAWERETGSKDVRIAVLDTGIDYEHQGLKDLVLEDLGRNFSDWDANEEEYLNEDVVMDEFGHGTHVAGIIASYGQVSGVMKQAALIPVRVLDGQGSGRISDVARGIAYAVDVEADIINLSLGGGYSQILEDKVDFARQQGKLLVAAAGNDGEKEVLFPARFNSVLAAGAVDGEKKRADFSNYGPSLDLMAPGVNVFSTMSSTYNMDLEEEDVIEIDGEKYAFISGTSMAAPHVAGMAGLIKSFAPDISRDDLADLIKVSARDIGSRNEFGEGLIDAYRGVGGRITEPYF